MAALFLFPSGTWNQLCEKYPSSNQILGSNIDWLRESRIEKYIKTTLTSGRKREKLKLYIGSHREGMVVKPEPVFLGKREVLFIPWSDVVIGPYSHKIFGKEIKTIRLSFLGINDVFFEGGGLKQVQDFIRKTQQSI